MKPVSGRQMARILRQRGWLLVRISSSHHMFGRPDSPLVIPVPVHGNRDLPTGTQRAIMRQAGLSEDDLKNQ